MRRVPIAIPAPTNEYQVEPGWSYLLIALLMVPSLIWILEDHTVWPAEQAWRGQVSVDLWYWLGHSLKQWSNTAANGLYANPPGIAWLGQLFVPLRGALGSAEAALLASILLTQFLMLVLVFRTGKRLWPDSRLIPVAGVLFASASQLFVGFSHQFVVEPIQALVVAWALYVVVNIPDWPRFRVVAHLAIAMIVGALAKAITPAYCLVPCVCASYLLVRRSNRTNSRSTWKSASFLFLVPAFGCLAVLCGLWYSRHFADVWHGLRDATSNDIVLVNAGTVSIFQTSINWLRLLTQSFFSPYFSWGCLAAIILGSAFYPSLRSSQGGYRLSVRPAAVMSAIQIALILFVLALNVTADPRHIYPLLPYAAVLFMQICVFVPGRPLAVLIVLGCIQWAAVNGTSLGLMKDFQNHSRWLLHLHSDRTQYDDLAGVVELTYGPEGSYNIVAAEEPWPSANSAAFFAAKHSLTAGTQSYYTSLGSTKDDNAAAAIRRITGFQTKYVITFNGAPGFVMRDARFIHVPFSTRTGISVFQFAPNATAR
jgi:hypothetical protein